MFVLGQNRRHFGLSTVDLNNNRVKTETVSTSGVGSIILMHEHVFMYNNLTKASSKYRALI